MKDGSRSMESQVARLLHFGTLLACCLVSVGLAMMFAESPREGALVVTVGITLFILLPVLRVALMLVAFLVHRDYFFAGIALVILFIIGTSTFVASKLVPISGPSTKASRVQGR
jgi:uncharacterized membrane protein